MSPPTFEPARLDPDVSTPPPSLSPSPAVRESPPGPRRGRLSNGRIAVVMLIATETMLFSGLIGAYVVLRTGAAGWPPADEPRLPIGVTVANTGVLLASAASMLLAVAARRRHDLAGLRRWLAITIALGSLFLLVQGSEWIRLLGHGLTLQSSTYGATFYTLIGMHGAHVLVALAWLGGLQLVVRGRPERALAREWVDLGGLYWYFVCGLWPFLFGLVYL